MQVYGPNLMCWAHRVPIDEEAKHALGKDLGGRLHALHLATVGPEYEFERALQGADVRCRHTAPPAARFIRRSGSHLRSHAGRQSAQRPGDCRRGLRRATPRYEPLRRNVIFCRRRQSPARERLRQHWAGQRDDRVLARHHAPPSPPRRVLGTALCQGNFEKAERLYGEICEEIRQEQEVEQQLDEAAKLHRFGRDRPRDRQIAHLLAGIGRGLPLAQLDFDTFLALGGLFLLDGQSEQDIRAYREQFDASIAALSGRAAPDAQRLLGNLLHVRFQPGVEEFREEKGIESSNKATEESPAIAIEARRQLAERIAPARALNERQSAFDAVDTKHISFDAAYSAAIEAIGDGASALTEADFGTFCGHTRTALLALASQLYDESNPEETQGFIERLSTLFGTRQIEEEHWRAVAGGYEDIGDLGRLAQRAVESAQLAHISEAERDRQLNMIARAGELFYSLWAIETTIAATNAAPKSATRKRCGLDLPLFSPRLSTTISIPTAPGFLIAASALTTTTEKRFTRWPTATTPGSTAICARSFAPALNWLNALR